LKEDSIMPLDSPVASGGTVQKDYGGIRSPFVNAIAPVHGGSDADQAGIRGGLAIENADKQTSGGETGQHIQTMSIRDSGTNPMKAAGGIHGS
jgi:hypothetical protein